jgi:UDP-N-acetylglucosamine 1-carboxyvinyltransferase
MSKFIITGGLQLAGEIQVSGSKNAALPLMAASLLTQDECVLTNVPEIEDVRSMAQILQELGGRSYIYRSCFENQVRKHPEVRP